MMRAYSVFVSILALLVLAGCGGQGPQFNSGTTGDSNFGFGSSSSTTKAAVNTLASSFWNIESHKRQIQTQELSASSEKAGDTQIVLKELTFEGERWEGTQTKVFAYLAYPVKGSGIKIPGIIHVHDVDQSAGKEFVTEWASRGYAAMSVDLPGCGRSTGPSLTIENIFKAPQSAKESSLYPAVCSILRAITVLSNQPSVDPFRIGVVGYGWGGVIALITNGIDSRVKAACTIYGSGYLSDNSSWAEKIKKIPSQNRKAWTDSYDPASYLKTQNGPVLFLTATGRADHTLPCLLKTAKETKVDKRLAMSPNSGKVDDLVTGDIPIWFDWSLKNGAPIAKVGTQLKGGTLTVTAKDGRPAVKAVLHYRPANSDKWQALESKPEKGIFTFTVPESSATSYFVSVIDDRSGVVSSEVGVYHSKNVKTASNRR